MEYKCLTCGYQTDGPGDCPTCNAALETTCENCGVVESECACG